MYYGLVDCNNFYASCERQFQPRYEGKPVVVLSNNDGCVIARSNEAKAVGVKMGVPYYQIKDLCRTHDVAAFSSNYELYGDMSRRVMTALSEFVQDVEIYSIDEAFLLLAGYDHLDLKKFGEGIVRKVSRIGPVSLGIAPTRTLAKVANKYAKKFPGYNGCCVIDSEEKRVKALSGFEVGDVWGVGRQYAKKLQSYGIRTALELAAAPRAWVRSLMTVQGERLWCELNGEPAVDIDDLDVPKKSICTSRSFGVAIRDKEDLREAVSTFAAMCAAKLRKQRSCAGAMMVFIHTNFFKKDAPQYSNSRIFKMPVATSITNELAGYALRGLDGIYHPDFEYKKAGVILYDIVSERAVLGDLFDTYPRERFGALMPVVDSLNSGFNRNLLQLACQVGPKKWGMKQGLRSGRFTTDVRDVIRVK
jgi:DNA polymerase V